MENEAIKLEVANLVRDIYSRFNEEVTESFLESVGNEFIQKLEQEQKPAETEFVKECKRFINNGVYLLNNGFITESGDYDRALNRIEDAVDIIDRQAKENAKLKTDNEILVEDNIKLNRQIDKYKSALQEIYQIEKSKDNFGVKYDEKIIDIAEQALKD